MSLYNDSDVNLLEQNIEDIIKRADDARFSNVEPTKNKMWEIIFTVRDFVIAKQRKIYGGFALNKLIEAVNPADKFYDDDNVEAWDIDFYSPEPINDANEIADELYKKGFKYVRVIEALHDETYKIFAETIDCADVSYVPRNIYRKIPFKIHNNLCLTGPHFLIIDYFRILSDPLTSYFRLEKSFRRLNLLQKYYPLPHSTSQINIENPSPQLEIAFNTVHDFLVGRETCVTVGFYHYNHLIKEAYANTKKKGTIKYINFVNVNFYEIISTSYKEDAKDLILALQTKFNATNYTVTFREFYPFFQYFGYSVEILLSDEVVCKIYNYNSKCIPYFDVPACTFKNKTCIEHPGNIRIGSFAVLMQYCLITIAKAKADDDKQIKNLYYTLISHIIELKNFYLKETGKTIMDESLFQEFVIRCTGKTNYAAMEKTIRIEKKKKTGKKYSYKYEPDKDTKNENKYIFKNSSGNEIQNEKNLKIRLNPTQIVEKDKTSDDDTL